ncbi:hypothetical protein L798_07659 [Zootermopsis nevadensis]|uniref:Uncharacterized protein n=1 Tax=Zootermopsis nevadensis TaxID=136037 RepID=A0A067RGA0_ZOONE|nr:hypothetical protein L798_07659 [Zootermopsis nevadensis]
MHQHPIMSRQTVSDTPSISTISTSCRDAGIHPGGPNGQRDARHPTLRKSPMYHDMDSVQPTSNVGVGETLPFSLVLSSSLTNTFLSGDLAWLPQAPSSKHMSQQSCNAKSILLPLLADGFTATRRLHRTAAHGALVSVGRGTAVPVLTSCPVSAINVPGPSDGYRPAESFLHIFVVPRFSTLF